VSRLGVTHVLEPGKKQPEYLRVKTSNGSSDGGWALTEIHREQAKADYALLATDFRMRLRTVLAENPDLLYDIDVTAHEIAQAEGKKSPTKGSKLLGLLALGAK